MARRANERGRMNYEDELCIQKHILDIENTIEAKDLTGPLFTRHIIDLDDMEFIRTGESRNARSQRFLNILIMRGVKAFQGFIESLESMGYIELAAKLKGSRTTTQELATSLSDNNDANNLSLDLTTLKRRVDDIEHTRARETDLGALRVEVKGELHNLASTLGKIEELSRVSRATENTINYLQKLLEEKDKLLAEAKEQINVLESKVAKLEQENTFLRRRMEQQEKQIRSLKLDVEKNKHEGDAQRRQDRREREHDRTENKDRFAKMERETKTKQDQLMNVVQTLVQQLADNKMGDTALRQVGARGLNVKRKVIVPKNRFQKDGK